MLKGIEKKREGREGHSKGQEHLLRGIKEGAERAVTSGLWE